MKGDNENGGQGCKSRANAMSAFKSFISSTVPRMQESAGRISDTVSASLVPERFLWQNISTNLKGNQPKAKNSDFHFLFIFFILSRVAYKVFLLFSAYLSTVDVINSSSYALQTSLLVAQTENTVSDKLC